MPSGADRVWTLAQQLVRLEAQRQAYAGIVADATKAAEYAKTIDGVSTAGSRVRDTEAQRDRLQEGARTKFGGAGGQPVTDTPEITEQQKDLATRIAMLEAMSETDKGLLAVIMTMKNRLNAPYANYGDDLGQVVKKRGAYSAYNPDALTGEDARVNAIDPNSYQYRRTRAMVDKTFSDDPDADPTGGATHYFAPGAKHAPWMDSTNNRKTIDSQTFLNPDGAPVPNAEQVQKTGEAVRQLNTSLREQEAIRDGGTAEQKQAAEQAEANLTEARNEVTEAEKLVATRREAAAATKDGTAGEQSKADKGVTEAQAALLEKQRAQSEAALSLEIAQAADGTEKKKALELDLANTRQARWAQGTAEWDEQEKAKTEIEKRYAAEAAGNETATENERFDGFKRGLANRQQAIRDQVSAGTLSGREALAEQRALLAEEGAEEQKHFAALEQINAAKPAMVRRYALQAKQVQDQLNAQDAKDQQAYLKDLEAQYRQHFEQIGSVVSSDLMGMIEGQKRFRDVGIDVLKSITQQALSSTVRMGADWAAHQAFNVAQTLLSQTQQTAAVAAGQAAQASAVTAGQAAAATTKATAMSGSIFASANETYAGVFGFLSPIMGPLAAGPALAAEGLVAAKAALPSFDVGAWSLPSDMVANVHAGEMIVPAGPAAMMRAAAGGGQSAGGGDTHVHAHFNVSTMDASSFQGFLRGGGIRTIAKELNQHMANNPSTRPRT